MALLVALAIAGADSLHATPVAPDAAEARADSVPWPDHPDIAERVATTIATQWGVTAERISILWGRPTRDFVPTTGTGVTVSGSGAGGYWFVELSDPASEQRTRLRVRAAAHMRVPVAARPLERLDVLAPGDIALEESLHWGDPASAAPYPVAPGWIAHRTIRVGDPLTEPSVRRPEVVQSGNAIRIEWARGDLILTVGGRALKNAGEGEEIYVRTDGGERLKGVVVGPGMVRVSDVVSTDQSNDAPATPSGTGGANDAS